MTRAPILFVHGFPFDHTMWRHLVTSPAVIARQYVAPDLPGAGGSPALAEAEYSMARYADDLVRALDARGVRQVVGCGLSMGGYILFELWRRHPERLVAMVLCSTKAEPDSAEGRRGRDEMAELARRHGAGAVADALIPRILSPLTLAANADVVREVRAMVERWSVTGIVGALRAMRGRSDSVPLLPSLRVPVLAIGGSDDAIAPRAQMEMMTRAIPGARFHAVPHAGHLSPLEQPRVVAALLAEFLESLG